MNTDMTIRDTKTPANNPQAHAIVNALRNLWDENERLDRRIWNLSERIENNIAAFMERFDLTLGEWHLWCRSTSRH